MKRLLRARRIAARSTPSRFAGGAVVKDRRGEFWRYSAGGDVWQYVIFGSVTSAGTSRSWQRLNAEFGPVTG